MNQIEQKLENSFHRRNGRELFEEHARDKEVAEKKLTTEHQENLKIIKTILDESVHMGSDDLVEIQLGREYGAVWSCYKNYYIHKKSNYSLKRLFFYLLFVPIAIISIRVFPDWRQVPLSDLSFTFWAIMNLHSFFILIRHKSPQDLIEEAKNEPPFETIKKTSTSKGGDFVRRKLLQDIYEANVHDRTNVLSSDSGVYEATLYVVLYFSFAFATVSVIWFLCYRG